MNVAKVIVVVAFVVFLAFFAWALETAPLSSLSEVILSNPWAIVLAADELLGFILFSVIIAFTERSPLRAAFWIAPIFLVGHMVTAIYLLGNIERIRLRLKRVD